MGCVRIHAVLVLHLVFAHGSVESRGDDGDQGVWLVWIASSPVWNACRVELYAHIVFVAGAMH